MDSLRDFVMQEPLFDNHEHQPGFSDIEKRREELTYRELLGYADADLQTALGAVRPGQKRDLTDDEVFFSAWPFVRTTGYGQAIRHACRELLGMEPEQANADRITEALREYAGERSGRQIYEDLFRAAGICGVVNDVYWDFPTPLSYFRGEDLPDFFLVNLRLDAPLVMTHKSEVEELERKLGRSLEKLSDLDEALDDYTEAARKAGRLAAVKIGLAYWRRLDFIEFSYTAAQRVFEGILLGFARDRRPLHDYLFHRMIERARAFDLPVQFHTGYLAGNWGDFRTGDPSALLPVLDLYRDVRFDLFHAGWPYADWMTAIGKACPNAYLDLCWAWAMSPVTMERVLDEWLGAVPHNKILAFGADTGSPFATLGYAIQARQGIANVLERKVQRGEYDVDTAKEVARRIMHANSEEIYPPR